MSVIFEMILEFAFAIVQSEKTPGWLKYPLMFVIVVFYAFILVGTAFLIMKTNNLVVKVFLMVVEVLIVIGMVKLYMKFKTHIHNQVLP